MNPRSANPEQTRSGLGSLQFGMRALFVVISLCAAASALFVWLGPTWTVAILFFGSLAAAHVIGNWMGTTLRAQAPHGDQPREEDQQAVGRLPEIREQYQPTKMQQRERIGKITLWSAVALGLLSAVAIAGLLAWLYGDEISCAGIGFAGLAAGTIGCLAAYAVVSFVGTLHTAWRDAVRGEECNRIPATPLDVHKQRTNL